MARHASPAAVVFDMDGLLLDTERLARECFDQACRLAGVNVAPDVYQRCIGCNREATAAILLEALESEADYRRLDGHWESLYHRRITSGPVPSKPGAVELLEALRARAIPCAVATSTSRPTATFKLQRSGMLSHFACLICGGETARGKPHPDPYLAAVTAIGAVPSASWALEDSENGVRSALAAGLTVYQVPDLIAPGDELRSLGHRVVDDLFEVLEALHLHTANVRGRNC